MLKRFVLAAMTALLAITFMSATANAASPSDRAPIPPPTDYWKDKGFILMAHQGGEWDFPPNTLFAYKSAMANGADMIDMDAYVTRDGKIVLTHDLDARKNSNLTDDMFEGRHNINDLDLSELKTLDFAYKWSPRDGSSSVPWRGIATGSGDENPPPEGFTRNDFKIPTFEEVLDAFPNTPINIELKQVSGVDIEDTAETMADILATHPGHDENVIINSFGQEMLDAMHAARPQHKSFSGSEAALLGYIKGDPITPTPVAVEPPDYFNLSGVGWIPTVPVLKPWADHDGYKIYVWGSDHDPAQDTDPFYAKLIEQGADSYNTPSPLTLAKYLCENGVASPDGTPRCPEQQCPEGQTGIAPNNCVPINCPDGTAGTYPDCQPICPVDSAFIDGACRTCPSDEIGIPPNCTPKPEPFATVKRIALSPKSAKVKAGKKKVLTLAVTASPGKPISVTVKLKSSNRKVKVQKKVKLVVAGGKTVRKKITVRTKAKAKGKAVIAATSGKLKAKTSLKVKPSCAKKKRRGGNLCGRTNHL